MSEEKAPIRISLNKTRISRSFRGDENLWKQEIGRILELISEHLSSIKETKCAKGESIYSQHERDQLSIALYGTYGSGKSSLLRTLVDHIKREKYKQFMDDDGKSLAGKIITLPVIDPTMLQENSNFLYAFLANVLEVDKERNKNHLDSQILTPLQNKIQSVCEYLQAIDKDGYVVQDDPVGASLLNLERQSSALRLVEHMSSFIDTLAEELGGHLNPVIILPVDDADMLPETLVQTFHQFRRFLQHPRLIPIFTFTGRIAEELLQIHFEEKLKITKLEKEIPKYQKMKEVSTDLTVAENLAVQFLGKLFPVRNRIRLGMASGRVQGGFYRPQNSGEGKPVNDLLVKSSRLLFGEPDPVLNPRVREPLRSATLRRQIQIIDVMEASGVKGMDSENNAWKRNSWAKVFDRTTWALLNVHRDILKEYHLNLDDLYSWTRKGLQQAISKSILPKKLENRREIIKKWRYNTEDRRGLMLSLLAANAFRPHMFDEDPSGDGYIVDGPTKDELDKYKRCIKDEKEDLIRSKSFSCRKGIVWFLNLWSGFYLPQIMARNRVLRLKDQPEYEPVSGIGWGLPSAAAHAVREALFNDHTYSTGMLFLDLGQFAMAINDHVANTENKAEVDGSELLADIWCFYGTNQGRKWAAVSFWRGLNLVGQLLELEIELQSKYAVFETKDRELLLASKRKGYVMGLLRQHLRTAHVLGTPPKETLKGNLSDQDHWESFGSWRLSRLDECMNKMVDSLCDWLKKYNANDWRITPMYRPISKESEEDLSLQDWQACFVRRIHGPNLIGGFWQDLMHPQKGELTQKWNARDALRKWTSILCKYWNCGRSLSQAGETGEEILPQENRTQRILRSCPIIEPFTPLGQFEASRFEKVVKGCSDRHLFSDEKEARGLSDRAQNLHKELEDGLIDLVGVDQGIPKTSRSTKLKAIKKVLGKLEKLANEVKKKIQEKNPKSLIMSVSKELEKQAGIFRLRAAKAEELTKKADLLYFPRLKTDIVSAAEQEGKND